MTPFATKDNGKQPRVMPNSMVMDYRAFGGPALNTVEDLIKKANTTEKSKYEKILAGLKNTKYPLLKNENKLNNK